jgi:hypothetical protein
MIVLLLSFFACVKVRKEKNGEIGDANKMEGENRDREKKEWMEKEKNGGKQKEKNGSRKIRMEDEKEKNRSRKKEMES